MRNLAALAGVLSADEQTALRLIMTEHRGAANAIHVPDLARAVGTSPRRLQSIIKHLVETFGLPIGGSTSAGIFWIETREEAEAVARHLRARGISALVHASRIAAVSREQFEAELAEAQAKLPLFPREFNDGQ